MNNNFWADRYPPGICSEIDPDEFRNVLSVLRASCERFAGQPAFSNMGHVLTYAELYRLSGQFAAWLQHCTDLQPGERIAIQLPNLLQYPVAIFGALRAGLVVVNTNPLYTVREMEQQLQDSGAAAMVCLASQARQAEGLLPATRLRHLIVTEVGDQLALPRRWVVNAWLRHVKKMRPDYQLPQTVRWRDALAMGKKQILQETDPAPRSIAILQYTGGTTGQARGAMLSHRNLVANMLQCRAMVAGVLHEGQEITVAPLPLYHIYAFTMHCLLMLLLGAHNVLITDPRNLPAFVRTLRGVPFTCMVGINTLFAALCDSEPFRKLDFSRLRVTVAGGMALSMATARRWKAVTGCAVAEGYGMTEASPVVSISPLRHIQPGTIGLPLPSTRCRVVDGQGAGLPVGMAGELCIRGPQVMLGYWQDPEATAGVLDAEGWLKTGDIAVIQPDGYLRIVDRKKDMILVSGFNVYPGELEEVLGSLPGVYQCAAIGVPDERSGEAVKIFVVPVPGSNLTADEVMQYMKARVTAYKRPKYIEFRDQLPTSNVGKVLRRALRAGALQEQAVHQG